MTPIRDLVLVKPYEADNISEGGIIVPDSAKKISNKVLIVETGRSVTKLKKGQTGYRVQEWGDAVVVNGELHFLMTQKSIIAIE